MRLLFAGSPDIAVPALRALARPDARWSLAGVLTNPDAPRGRSGRPECSAVARAAEDLGVPVLKFATLKAEAREAVSRLSPDLLVTFAFGRIFGPKFLALFPRGGINIHPSLLPKYRGPSPIYTAIRCREEETGISVQTIGMDIDAGDILYQERIPLDVRETTDSVSALVAERSGSLVISVLEKLAAGLIEGRAQDGSAASFTRLVSREDGRIDWGAGAAEIDAQVRACTPWPLAFTTHNGTELFILEADVAGAAPVGAAPGTVLGVDRERGILIQTGDGVLAVRRLQYRAKKALDFRAFMNGARGFAAARLGV